MDVLARVGSSRLLLEGKFPYPSAVDCMRYAIQEMAEYDDARMRQDQPDHKRNNERTGDARKELGQAGYMILSALLKMKEDIPTPFDVDDTGKLCLWSGAVMNLSSAIWYMELSDTEAAMLDLSYCWDQCAVLMQHHGWNPDELIAETCEAFEAKHLGVQA